MHLHVFWFWIKRSNIKLTSPLVDWSKMKIWYVIHQERLDFFLLCDVQKPTSIHQSSKVESLHKKWKSARFAYFDLKLRLFKSREWISYFAFAFGSFEWACIASLQLSTPFYLDYLIYKIKCYIDQTFLDDFPANGSGFAGNFQFLEILSWVIGKKTEFLNNFAWF